MKVELIYFKPSGKYYSEGHYETKLEFLFEIWDEVREMVSNKELPGLMRGHSDFYVLVNVPGHKHEHPRLIKGG